MHSKELFVRNMKKGFATNSSSYHTTITRYIEVPKKVWIEFTGNKYSEFVGTNYGGYAQGLILQDDEDGIWTSYEDILEKSVSRNVYFSKEYELNGETFIRIWFETEEEY